MLDMRSIFFIQNLILIVCFFVIFMAWRQSRKRYRGISCWTSMMALSCVGYLLLALRDMVPDFFSIFLANLFLVCAFALFNRGLSLFYGVKNNLFPSIAVILAVVILQITFTYYMPDIRARIFVISAAFLVLYGHGMWILLFKITPKQRAVSKAFVWSMAAILFLYLYRILIHLFFPTNQPGLMQQSILDNLYIILQVPIFLLLVFNMVGLVSNFLMIEVKEEEEKFNSIFHLAPYAAIITNSDDSRVIEANDEMLRLLEYTRKELIGSTLLDLGTWVDPNQRTILLEQLKAEGAVSGLEIKFRSKSGKIFPVLFSASILNLQGKQRILSTMKDISDIDRLKSELEELASHDMLTGLPNRRKFDEICAIQLARASRSGERLAMVMFDIDDFKLINDEHGHYVGDKVLVGIADRLRDFSRSSENIARHGGDEFTILLIGLNESEDAETALDRLFKLYEEPIVVDGVPFKIGLSMGVAMYPENGVSTEELLRKADKALYEAKSQGKNCISFASGDSA
jgi:diguanylate cyclase (GGDEF)-like protein/PAS domain S-box-containing protein